MVSFTGMSGAAVSGATGDVVVVAGCWEWASGAADTATAAAADCRNLRRDGFIASDDVMSGLLLLGTLVCGMAM